MSQTNPRPTYYLTTPIYYANARPHIGTTYSTLVADTIARLKRMQGYDVSFVTGTDEHGQNISRAAEKAGITPREHVDRLSAVFRSLWNELDITYTNFIRTTSPEHLRAVRRLLLRARDAGYIYKKFYEGRYCVFDNLYVTDSTEPADCPLCGRPAEIVSEENYFFKLSAFQDRLLQLYNDQPDFIRPDFRRNEVVRFVEAGLKDISVSRRRKVVPWGLPWPDDDEHVVYVWYDALTSYLSAIGYGDDELKFEKYWPAQLHLIGKEIIRFHCVYWPAFLWAAEEQLPKGIFAHGWLLFDQQKMSKSKGNVAYAEPVARTLGTDALRYYLLREVSFGQDGNFSHDSLVTRYNSDLANGLGNLASRTLAMIEQYQAGIIDREEGLKPISSALQNLCETQRDKVLSNYETFDFSRALEEIWALIAHADLYLTESVPWVIRKEPDKTWQPQDRWMSNWGGNWESNWGSNWGSNWRSNPASSAGLEENAGRDTPATDFTAPPTNAAVSGEILYAAAETLRWILVLAHPALPNATERIWQQLGQRGRLSEFRIADLTWGELESGTHIGELAPVFPRIEKKEALERMATMEDEIRQGSGAPATPATPAAAAPAPPGTPAAAGTVSGGRITIDDFAKVEMRVGLVKSAEKVAGADKLLKLEVDIGEDSVRQIVAGIATAYAPESLVGRKVVVVANLAPRKLRGVESNGMIMAASLPDGQPVLASFLEDVPVGSRLK